MELLPPTLIIHNALSNASLPVRGVDKSSVVPSTTPVTFHTHATFGVVRVRWTVTPTSPQSTQANSIIVALDLSPTGQIAAATTQQRTDASNALLASERDARAWRAIVSVLVDELNILRSQIVGVATTVFNPGVMANATGKSTTNIAITSAAFGDFVDVAAPYTLQGATATGFVATAGQVQIRVHNGTGGSLTLASGTWNLCVRRHVVLPARTLAQAKSAVQSAANSSVTD